MRVYERSEELRRKDERQTLAVEMVAIHLPQYLWCSSARLHSTAQHSTAHSWKKHTIDAVRERLRAREA